MVKGNWAKKTSNANKMCWGFMVTENYTFTCLGYVPTDDNRVENYIISVMDVGNGKEQILSIAPDKIGSHISMKKILLGHNIIYFPTKKEHHELLQSIFSKKLSVICRSDVKG